MATMVAVAFVALLLVAVVQSHQAMNRPEPDVQAARQWLVAAHAVAAGSALLLVLLAGRHVFWLIPPVLLGALHLFDVFEAYRRHGLDAELGMSLTLLAVAHGIILALALWGCLRSQRLRPIAAWVPFGFLAAWAGAFLFIGPTLLRGLNQQAQDIRASWTYDHADPPVAFGLAILAIIVIVARRRLKL